MASIITALFYGEIDEYFSKKMMQKRKIYDRTYAYNPMLMVLIKALLLNLIGNALLCYVLYVFLLFLVLCVVRSFALNIQ